MNRAFTLGAWLMRIRPAPLASFLKNAFRVKRVLLRTPAGTFWLDPASQFGQAIFHDHRYDPETLAQVEKYLRPNDTFIDIGANEGYFSVVASRLVLPHGRVIAVEPQKRLLPVLERNFALNDCPSTSIVAAAISDQPGTLELRVSPDMNTGASGFSQRTRYAVPLQPTPCVTLAELCRRECSDGELVIKMDIESWEFEALTGSEELLRSGRIRALILELHPEMMAARGRSPQELDDFLVACGYRRTSVSGWEQERLS